MHHGVQYISLVVLNGIYEGHFKEEPLLKQEEVN